MNTRRLVGIDLGIASAHTVRVLDGEGVRGHVKVLAGGQEKSSRWRGKSTG